MTYRLRLPGPTAVPDRVQQAIASPMLNHRGPEFRKIFARVQELIQPILGTKNPVLFLAGSGTAGMEASLVNILVPGERVLVCVTGQFGERFEQIATALGAQADTVDVTWGKAVDPAAIEQQIQRENYRAVVVVHNESSTAVVADLASIGKILRDTPTLLIVDSVSGLGGIEMRQDDWGIDILVSASQKALMCPPGIALASVSAKALPIVNREGGLARYSLDFRKALAHVGNNETPFTPPVSLLAGLKEALEMVHEEGLPRVLDRHRRLSKMLREGCEGLGLRAFGQADALSNTVVALEVPDGLNGGDIVRTMYEKHGTVIAGSRNKLKGRVIRVGTMGSVTDNDIMTDLDHLNQTLKELRSVAGHA